MSPIAIAIEGVRSYTEGVLYSSIRLFFPRSGRFSRTRKILCVEINCDNKFIKLNIIIRKMMNYDELN